MDGGILIDEIFFILSIIFFIAVPVCYRVCYKMAASRVQFYQSTFNEPRWRIPHEEDEYM